MQRPDRDLAAQHPPFPGGADLRAATNLWVLS
jgi:hypothetical protein